MTFEEFQIAVIGWAEERGIYEHSNAMAQLLKAVSEMGELADAEIKGDYPGMEDAVGDVLVCLINYGQLAGVSMQVAMHRAWGAIQDRKGRMVAGGAFVKDET